MGYTIECSLLYEKRKAFWHISAPVHQSHKVSYKRENQVSFKTFLEDQNLFSNLTCYDCRILYITMMWRNTLNDYIFRRLAGVDRRFCGIRSTSTTVQSNGVLKPANHIVSYFPYSQSMVWTLPCKQQLLVLQHYNTTRQTNNKQHLIGYLPTLAWPPIEQSPARQASVTDHCGTISMNPYTHNFTTEFFFNLV